MEATAHSDNGLDMPMFTGSFGKNLGGLGGGLPESDFGSDMMPPLQALDLNDADSSMPQLGGHMGAIS